MHVRMTHRVCLLMVGQITGSPDQQTYGSTILGSLRTNGLVLVGTSCFTEGLRLRRIVGEFTNHNRQC
jgi:hypothetical protein